MKKIIWIGLVFMLFHFCNSIAQQKNNKIFIREKVVVKTDNLIKYDLIPNAKTAIKIAEAVWLPIYGKKIYKEKPFIAKLNSSKIWIVEGSVYGTKGGAAYIEIQKKDGKILKVYHEK